MSLQPHMTMQDKAARRRMIADLVSQGRCQGEIAEVFGLSRSYVNKIYRQLGAAQ